MNHLDSTEHGVRDPIFVAWLSFHLTSSTESAFEGCAVTGLLQLHGSNKCLSLVNTHIDCFSR